MFKKLKKTIGMTLAFVMAFSFFGTAIISNAEETALFIPNRSEYVAYITQNASNNDAVLEYVWFKLFEEETNWNPSASYYSAKAADPSGNVVTASKWASKYYSNYVSSTGEIKSSYNTQVTYNADFDGFLYQTIVNNSEFVINWINKSPATFNGYASSAASHPLVAKAIMEVTSSAAGNRYLGNGKDSLNNVFLAGISSTASTKSGTKNDIYGRNYPYAPKWNATSTSRSTYDISVLKFFGSDYSGLGDYQKYWVKTYLSWLVSDYAANGTSGVASKNNSINLYNLMAVSYEGFANTSVNQELFDWSISNNNVAVGSLIVNVAERLGETGSLYTGTADVEENINMAAIFAGDADCDYTSASNLGDDDYDWLAYQICFSNSAMFDGLRALVVGNSTTYEQEQEWLRRYAAKNPSDPAVNIPFGQTEEVTVIDGNLILGCGKEVWHDYDPSFWCYGHSATYSSTVGMPVGTASFTFSSSGTFNSVSYKWKVWDASTGTVIDENTADYAVAPTIEILAKYRWSSSISVWFEAYYVRNAGGHIGYGSCQNGTVSTSIAWTYVDLSSCDKDGHTMQWSYQFYDANGNALASGSTAIPSYCVASGYCKNCTHTEIQYDYSLTSVEYSNSIVYTADFAHLETGAKSFTVSKGTGGLSQTFSPSKNISQLSGSCSGLSASGAFSATSTKTVVYTGDGTKTQLYTSANGTVSLKAGNILQGVSKITVTATAQNVVVVLANATGQVDRKQLTSGSSTTTKTCTFDCSGYSDGDLDGIYVYVMMNSSDQNIGGHDIGDTVTCTSKVQFESITILY